MHGLTHIPGTPDSVKIEVVVHISIETHQVTCAQTQVKFGARCLRLCKWFWSDSISNIFLISIMQIKGGGVCVFSYMSTNLSGSSSVVIYIQAACIIILNVLLWRQTQA